jgi:hypothetical protein
LWIFWIGCLRVKLWIYLHRGRAADCESVDLFVELLALKAKPSGLPDSNFIFFVATKKTKQKKTWRGAWHVWLDITVTSI